MDLRKKNHILIIILLSTACVWSINGSRSPSYEEKNFIGRWTDKSAPQASWWGFSTQCFDPMCWDGEYTIYWMKFLKQSSPGSLWSLVLFQEMVFFGRSFSISRNTIFLYKFSSRDFWMLKMTCSSSDVWYGVLLSMSAYLKTTFVTFSSIFTKSESISKQNYFQDSD